MRYKQQLFEYFICVGESLDRDYTWSTT